MIPQTGSDLEQVHLAPPSNSDDSIGTPNPTSTTAVLDDGFVRSPPPKTSSEFGSRDVERGRHSIPESTSMAEDRLRVPQTGSDLGPTPQPAGRPRRWHHDVLSVLLACVTCK